jgi:hypothetical protein
LLFNADASEWLQDASLPVKIFHVTFQRKGSGMNNIETQLLESGFTVKELAYLNRNISRYGSSLLEVVLELGKRFIMVLFLTAVVALIFVALLFFAEHYNIVSGGISLFIVLVIVWFFQPPVITYKAWRYRKKYISSGQTH